MSGLLNESNSEQEKNSARRAAKRKKKPTLKNNPLGSDAPTQYSALVKRLHKACPPREQTAFSADVAFVRLYVTSLRETYPELPERIIRQTAMLFAHKEIEWPDAVNNYDVCEALGRSHEYIREKFRTNFSKNTSPQPTAEKDVDVEE